MLISIDPENLKSVAQKAQNVNADIEVAMQLLNQISTHNDWNCKERKQINEYTSQNKNKIRILKENSDDFLNAVQQAAQDFQNTEKNLSTIFESVEETIKSVLSITPIVEKVPVMTVKAIGEIYKNSSKSGYASNILELAKKAIPIVRYSDINLTSGNENSGGSGKTWQK